MHRTLAASHSRFVSSLATTAFVVLLITTSLLVRLPAQSQMPNENCSDPKMSGGLCECDVPAGFPDAGVASTLVTACGAAIREAPTPRIQSRLSGRPILHRRPLRFDVSYSAWDAADV